MTGARFRAANRRQIGALASLVAASVVLAPNANASGLYFTDRGVRAGARGGAFVAGVDDLEAIHYNPAGLAEAGRAFYLDMSWLNYSLDFTRKTRVIDAAGTSHIVTSPTVHGSTPVLPIPMIAASFQFGEKKEFTAAFGVHAPFAGIVTYPDTVNGAPAPQRYSVISMDGSLLVEVGGFLATKPTSWLEIGVGVQALVGSFATSVYFNANPNDRLIGAPEDPKYDALSQLNAGPIFSPSASAGVTFLPSKAVRIGLSGQLPYLVNAPGKIQVRLPSAVLFDNASQQGQDIHVKFELPATIRLGIEVRPVDALRIEAAYVRELWSTFHSIDISPDNVTLVGVTGFPSPFKVGNISIPHNYESANSFRLGGEYAIKLSPTMVLDARLGVHYDTSAIPLAHVSPLIFDTDKVVLGLGAGLHVGERWRIDATFQNVFMSAVTVSPDEAQMPRVNPVKGNPTDSEAINGGDYKATAFAIGLGVNYKY